MLEYLSQEELVSLMRDYYSGVTSKQLVEKYHLPHNQGIYKFFPEFERKDRECPYCKVPMYSKRVSKSERSYSGKEYEPDAKCHICGHQEIDAEIYQYRRVECQCANCQQKKKQEIECREKAVQDFCTSKNLAPSRKNSDITFRDRTLFGAILLSQSDINSTIIVPANQLIKKFSPEYPDMAIKYPKVCWNLFKKTSEMFIAQDKVPLSAFKWTDDGNFDSFDLAKIPYIITINAKSYTDICFKSFFTIDQTEAAVQFWYEIATEECLEYLSVRFNRFQGFPKMEVNDKMRQIIHNMLEYSSVSQIFFLLDNSLNYTSRMYAEGRMRKIYIPAATVTTAATHQKNYLANGWNIREYHRTKDNPVSVVSSYFFDVVLKIGEKGFNCIPSREVIEQTWTERSNGE